MDELKPKFALEPWNHGISDDDLLVDLKRVAGGLGKTSVSSREYDELGRCASKTLERRFGGWNNALVRAGLEVGQRVGLSDDDFYENLEEVWTRLGRQPRREDLIRPISRISGSNYERRFGGWRKALEAFIEWAEAEQPIGLEQQTTPNHPNVHRTPRSPSLRLKFKVMRRDRFSCRHCGRSPANAVGIVLHVDHIEPWSLGGETVFENLQTLCESCNLGKSNLAEAGDRD